jgi:hypothetical protein
LESKEDILFKKRGTSKKNQRNTDYMYRYGPIRQVRVGTAPDTKGTAFVVYEDIFDAKAACDHLSGFNIMG